MNIRNIDHLTLTVSDIERSVRWYHEVFDLPIIEFDDGRRGVKLGKQKINFPDRRAPSASRYTLTIGGADFAIIMTN